MELKTGYIQKPHDPDHKVFGSANEIGDAPINPSGDWTQWLPPQDVQQNVGFSDPECCVSEATKGALEILANQQFGDTTEWSARFLAWVSGTGNLHGNDPKTVVLALESKGNVPEKDWANTAQLTTWEEFYATPPQNIQTEALEFIAEYAVHSEWVNPDVISMQSALQYSPLTVAGYAWAQQPDGLYYSPPNTEPCHDFIVYDCVPNVKWMVFDSYSNDLKQLEWNYVFSDVMRYSIVKNVGNTPTEVSAWQQFLTWMNKILGLGEYSAERLGGKARSPKWSGVRNAYLKEHPVCEVCGGTKKLTIHHRAPFHLHPEDELNPDNLCTLCEGAGNGNHHLIYGHWGNYRTKYNPELSTDCSTWVERFNHETMV